PVSTAAYYLWPGMKYFRHIGLVSSFVKVLMCFVAGVGFERLLTGDAADDALRRRVAGVVCALVLAAGTWLSIDVARSDMPLERLGGYVQTIDRPSRAFDARAMAARLRSTAGWNAAGAAVVILSAFAAAQRRSALRTAAVWTV